MSLYNELTPEQRDNYNKHINKINKTPQEVYEESLTKQREKNRKLRETKLNKQIQLTDEERKEIQRAKWREVKRKKNETIRMNKKGGRKSKRLA